MRFLILPKSNRRGQPLILTYLLPQSNHHQRDYPYRMAFPPPGRRDWVCRDRAGVPRHAGRRRARGPLQSPGNPRARHFVSARTRGAAV